ncbi:MAG: hypothetical protein H6736_12025 [Alphaproteobacteria bacterium]|nr:hypothetical protein [Alphaproteobacteria bacterium]MCB9692532.1 hypothetical protein [Alphaproteobacteria bacterium]
MNPLLRDVLTRLDEDALRALVKLVSVDPVRERSRLRAAGRAYASPDGRAVPTSELDATAAWVVSRATRRRGLTARLVGLAGAPSVPGEVLSESVGLLRLAQRLAVVYGFDPSEDRGRTALWRALSAALEIELPEHAPIVPRATAVLQPGSRSLSGTLLRAVLGRATADAADGPLRFLPVVGSVRAPETSTAAMGERMARVLSRLAEPAAWSADAEAEELPPR